MLGFAFLVFVCLCSVSGEGDSDKLILLEFKNSISSDNGGLLSSWNAKSSNHCSWHGVTCDADSRVVALEIYGGNFDSSASCSKRADLALHGFGMERNCSANQNGGLVGTLPPVIGKLTELRVLALPFNEFVGELPGEIWSLKDLEVLDLEGNSFTGNLSRDFARLRNLQVLNLGFNKITGAIPTSLSECKGLRVLNLAGNQILGVIPGFVGDFEKLEGVYLSMNRLIGSIPDELGKKCMNLEHLDLSRNYLNGKIPTSLGDCRNLRSLLLFSNAFSGSIPSELGNLRSLEVVDVSRNMLVGPIPSNLGNCLNLSVIVFSSHFNQLPLVEKTRVGNRLQENSFQGSIPAEVTMLPKLKILWAPFANLEGEFPRSWGSCYGLEMVNLAGNSFTGEISGVFEKCQYLHFLNLSSNRIRGEIDGKLRVSCMTLFDISRNQMSGSLPSFPRNSCPRSHSPHSSFFPSVQYISFFSSKTCLEVSLALSLSAPTIVHDFSENNFTGSVPLLPIAPKRIGKNTEYAFLAGANKISGLFNGILFGRCNEVNGMFINVSDNIISDQIPANIDAKCKSLKFLDASNNKVSGEIPRGIMNLKDLTGLLLNNNKLHGKVPVSVSVMVSLKKFNLSYNNLSGPLKSTSNLTICSSFYGNPLLSSCPVIAFSLPPSDQQVNEEQLSSTTSDSKNGSSGFNATELACIISASVVVTILLALVAFFFYKRKLKPDHRIEVLEPSDGNNIVVFNDVGVPLTFDSIFQATGNFTATKCIGSGGFGSTYKAEISPGTVVAVKRLTVEMCQGVPQFNAEIQSLRNVSHPSLITLVGYYASNSEMFLIYNYIPGGNLEQFILKRRNRIMTWKIIHNIAVNIASALEYLHGVCNPRILHRDVKPNNVLLDENYNAYLSDFGLSRLLEGFQTHVTTGVAGTFGYVAPEYALTCRVSDKADVYSFGVLLLELISDKRALDPSFSVHENGFTIVTWAMMMTRENRENEVFSDCLRGLAPENVLMDLLHLAICCTCESSHLRPSMRQVVQNLRQIQPHSG